MSREIKFRAWLQGKHDNINFGFDGFMDHDVTIQNGQWCSVESGWDIQSQYRSIPLMQYTGLTDKNGKEIYEGDIVKVVNDIGIVVFRDAMFIVEWQCKTIRSNLTHNSIEQIEIIGNIHETQHLLEK